MKTKNVIVAFTIGSIAGRNCLSGVFDFVNAGHPWKIRYMQNPDELTPDVVKNAAVNGIDGVITGFRERTEGMVALAQIASECGFGSANRLSHVFQERFGIYPSALRHA